MLWLVVLLFLTRASSMPPGKVYDASTTASPTTVSVPDNEAPHYAKTDKPPATLEMWPRFHPQYSFFGSKSARPPVPPATGCPPCQCARKANHYPQVPHGPPGPGKTEAAKEGKEGEGGQKMKDHVGAEKTGHGDSGADAESRQRRALPDYWHDLGGPNGGLGSDLGYSAVRSIQDQLDRFGPPLHAGKISSSDFNYPKDFNLFNTPGRKQDLLIQAGFYQLTGPLTVTVDPAGDLVGPLPNGPDTFTTLVLTEGIFRMSTVQKNSIFKIQDPNSGVVFVVNCLRQSGFASCNNLKKIQ